MAQGGQRNAARGLPALAAGRLPTLAGFGSTVGGWCRAGIARDYEQRRLFPWLAVAFGAGILVQFTATDGPPALAAPLVAAALVAATAPLLRARPVPLALACALTAALLGFAAATHRTASVAAPILTRTMIAPLTGLVEALDEREEGARLIVRVASFGSLDAAARPTRVRVSYRTAQRVRPGDFLSAQARLLPPPEAARPGGYDFARDAYFRGIGAVGSLVGRIAVSAPADPLPWRFRLAAGIDDARNALTRRITDATGGQAGAVAAALVTGKRGLIDARTNEVLRAAGIYHVVSISGLHMVLAAGVVFWLVRGGLALVPWLALTWPIKKIAAGVAMAGVTAYCAFSGWDVAAERALIMTLVMLGAILVDRPALSMRNLALAAIVALAREPEALLGPSFQMSFGAVAGLIAGAPLLDRRLFGRFSDRDGSSRVVRALWAAATAVVGTLATTVIAQVATAPFATYHFQTVQPFGLIGNALTLPLVSLAVMPSAVLGMLAFPFALDRPVWWLMGQAVHGMLAISAWIAGFGRANLVVPAFGPAALALLAGALLIASLAGSRLRWLALAPAAAGVTLAAAPTRYDVYVDRQGTAAAVRGADGRLAVLGKPSGFVLEHWLRADGDARPVAEVMEGNDAPGRGARCDPLGCTIRAFDGRWVALVRDKRAFREDCARADILISARDKPPGCDRPLVVDRAVLARGGAVAIRLGASDLDLRTTRKVARGQVARASTPFAPPAREPRSPALLAPGREPPQTDPGTPDLESPGELAADERLQ